VEYPDLDKIRHVLSQSGKQLYWLDATSKAMEIGDPILLNMVMIGALCALGNFPLGKEDIKETLRNTFSESKWDINTQALDVGETLIRDYES
jgi:indolepyruvate ferredoxin oxidoreductase beta subunit